MENNSGINNNASDARHNYAAASPQQAMYGYPPPLPPNGAGYPRNSMNMIPSTAPGPVYNMQQQYQTSGQPVTAQMQAYANMTTPAPIMQSQPQQYSMPQVPQYQQQMPPYQGQSFTHSQPQMRMHQQPQQYMHSQPLQAYQLDGPPSQPTHSPVMRQPQGYHGQHAHHNQNQQRPRSQQQMSGNHVAVGPATPNSRPVHSTPARPQSQSRPQPQVEIYSRPPSQSQPQSQGRPQPQVQVQNRTPSQPRPQTGSSPQVQIQVPHSRPPSQSHPQPQSQSQSQHRRQSNSQSGSQQRPIPQQRTPQIIIETKRPQPQSRGTPATSHTATPSREIPVDYQMLLLGLADQYISKAHGMSAFLARNTHDADVDQYYSLISAGLGCMESVLKNWKFPDPRVEARLQLRYANLLLEETENDDELQDLLIKGVALCDRNRLNDLKYSMKHLQARAYFRTNPRAAFKMIDQLIDNTETYRQLTWMYVFRFLRVSLSLQLPRADLSAAYAHLRRIYTLAEQHKQVPILATASALEALVHLRGAHADSVDLAQRALANARTHQLNPTVAAIPQLKALLDCLDLCCDLVNQNPEQMLAKMRVMQKAMDDGKRSASWSSDGSFCVPTSEEAPQEVSEDTGGIMQRNNKGQRAITFQWIRRSELFALGYIFSSLASINKNVVDGKAEKYVIEGSKVTLDEFNPENERRVQSLNSASAHLDRRAFYHHLTLQQLVFAKCDRSNWDGASEILATITEGVDPDTVERNDFIQTTTLYLMGVVRQATGDLEGALKCFKSLALTLQEGQKSLGANNDLRILSTLNTILILRPRPECRGEVDRLMEMLEYVCPRHPNGSFQSALNIIRASATANLPILKMKNFLSMSANIAKKQSNQQLLCITINLMTSTFFVDIMGDKAEMSAGVGKHLAERTKNPLWQAVANQMLANTLDFGGKRNEAVQARNSAGQAFQRVPEDVQKVFER